MGAGVKVTAKGIIYKKSTQGSNDLITGKIVTNLGKKMSKPRLPFKMLLQF